MGCASTEKSLTTIFLSVIGRIATQARRLARNIIPRCPGPIANVRNGSVMAGMGGKLPLGSRAERVDDSDVENATNNRAAYGDYCPIDCGLLVAPKTLSICRSASEDNHPPNDKQPESPKGQTNDAHCLKMPARPNDRNGSKVDIRLGQPLGPVSSRKRIFGAALAG